MKISPTLALAYAEDAAAIASWAEAQGFSEDAERMREFAVKVRRQIPQSKRWEGRTG